MEACATSHYWAREITAPGHEVRMMPMRYVKPFVKRNKNDMADSLAICEVVSRPTMRFVPMRKHLVAGAHSGVKQAKRTGSSRRPWPIAPITRRSTKVAVIALATKIARIVWAMMVRGTHDQELH